MTDTANLTNEIIALHNALFTYVKAQSAMLEKWSEVSTEKRNELWRNLHACEGAGRAALSLGNLKAMKNIVARPTDDELVEMIHEGCLIAPDGEPLPTSLRRAITRIRPLLEARGIEMAADVCAGYADVVKPRIVADALRAFARRHAEDISNVG